MRLIQRVWTLCTVWVLAGSAGCSPSAKSSPSEPLVAQVGDRRFTVREVEALIQAEPPFLRARYDATDRKREFVESLVQTELLVQEARRLKLDERPEVRSVMDRLLVQQLVAEATKGKAPSEAEARSFYEARLADFTRPERVGVAMVEFGGRGTLTPAPKAEVEKELARLRALKEPERKRAFDELVLARSTHEGSRAQGGDLGLRTREELTAQFGPAVAQAAFSLRSVGEVSAAAESSGGIVVLRLLFRQPEETRSFESERARIEARLGAEQRTRDIEGLVSRLKGSTTVSIDATAVEKLEVKAPTGPLLP